MRRGLFLVELRRTALQVAVLTAAFSLVLLVVEAVGVQGQGRNATDVGMVVDLMALGTAAAVGLILGTQTYGGDSRRRELEFVGSLPIGRGEAFWIMLASRVAAGMVGFVILVALRPRLVTTSILGIADTVSVTPLVASIALHLLLLALGLCLGGLFRRVAAAYAVAIATLALLTVETVWGVTSSLPAPDAIWTGAGVLVLGWIGIAGWQAWRGEPDLSRVRRRGWVAVGAFAAVFAAVFQRPPRSELFEPSRVAFGGAEACEVAVLSAAGGDRSLFTIFDTRNGSRLGRFELPKVLSTSFAADRSAIWSICNRHWPSRLLDLAAPRGPAVYRWVAGERAEHAVNLPSAKLEAFEAESGRRVLVASRDEVGIHLVEIGGEPPAVRPRLLVPPAGDVALERNREGWVFSIARADGPTRWLVADTVHQLPAASFDAIGVPPTAFRDRAARLLGVDLNLGIYFFQLDRGSSLDITVADGLTGLSQVVLTLPKTEEVLARLPYTRLETRATPEGRWSAVLQNVGAMRAAAAVGDRSARTLRPIAIPEDRLLLMVDVEGNAVSWRSSAHPDILTLASGPEILLVP